MSSRGEQGNGETTIVGARLRRLREESGLSLAAMAARVPYSRAALGHYETGTRATPPEVIAWYERVRAGAALPTRRSDPRAADAAIATAIATACGSGRPLIEIGRPHQGDKGTGYFCPFRIDGLIEGEAAGTDAATALHSALRAVSIELGERH